MVFASVAHRMIPFFTASAIWLLLRAEFLAIALVLVYVGAVMVLFLFVVMMLDINTDSFRQNFWRHFPLAGVVGAALNGGILMLSQLVAHFKVTASQRKLSPTSSHAPPNSHLRAGS